MASSFKKFRSGVAPVALCDAARLTGGSWGEDGNIVAALHLAGGLSKVQASGGTPQPLTDLKDDEEGAYSHRWPQVLPSGKGVLFTSLAGGGQDLLRVLAPDGKAKTLVENAVYGRYLAGGHLLYYQGGTLFAATMDLNSVGIDGTRVASRARSGLWNFARGGFRCFQRKASLTKRRGGEQNSRFLAGLVQQDFADNSRTCHLCIPASIAGWHASDQHGQRNLSIYNITRETTTQLTFGSLRSAYPVWRERGTAEGG